jgi:hypothetical protein
LAAGVFGEALAKAVDYAQTALAPATEKIYADDWAPFASGASNTTPPISRRRLSSLPPTSPIARRASAAAGCA